MKKATLALALGLLIGSATTAIAATDTVQATIAKFKFVVNGEKQQLKNDPLVRNGVTYLPVRETAELLGAQVDFKNGTITLDAPSEASSQQQTNPTLEGEDSVNAVEDGVIKLQHSEIKILGYEYLDELITEEYGEMHKQPDEVFIAIDLEILLLESSPAAGIFEGYSPLSFLGKLKVENSPVNEISSKYSTSIIKPGIKQEVKVIFTTGVQRDTNPLELELMEPSYTIDKTIYKFHQ